MTPPSEQSLAVAHEGEGLVAQRQRAGVRLGALFVGVAIMVLGNGLAGTLLGVRAGLEGMDAEIVGLLMSAYFVGFAVGSYLSPQLIGAVGHVRTFAALASVASAAALTYAIIVSPLAWLLLRMLHGACYAGLVVVVESWLNGMTRRRDRGRVLALYNLILLAAWAASQPLLTLAPPSGFVLFCVVSICLSLALVPITLTRAGIPGVVQAARTGLGRLYEISPMATFAALATGLNVSAFFGMGPTFAQRMGLTDSEIGYFMSAPILGALALQWPLGWLSDVVDRRLVIIGAGVLGTLAAAGASLIDAEAQLLGLLGLTFLYGGSMLPLYALAVAHVNDHIDSQELVAAASGLVMVYGVGASIGPFAASLAMTDKGADGLFLFSAVVLGVFVAFALVRLTRRGGVAQALKRAFVAVPRTSHAALQMHKHRKGPSPGPRAPG